MADKDIVAELQEWEHFTAGTMPDQWAPALNEALNRAIAEILRLRALVGAVSAGNGDFRTVKALLPHAGTSFADIVDEMAKNPDSGQTPAKYTGC